jgi:small subunit ribosomal protein S4
MKKPRKKYERPLKLWDKERIEREKILVKSFGLRRKKEIWRAEALLRKYRRMARELAAKKDKEKEKMLVDKLIKVGLLQEGADLDDVLDLTLEILLERRLQTILQKKGLVNSVKQARQFITHGHVRIGERRIVYPSYLVSKEEEGKIQIDIVVNKPKVIANGS